MSEQTSYSISFPERSKNEKWNDYVYRTLYANIMDLSLAPGSLINEKILVQQFECSRTPIREALLRLQSDFLIEIHPQSKIQVTPIDYQIIREMQFMRAALEEKIIIRLCREISSQHLLQLHMNLIMQEHLYSETDPSPFCRLDMEFHNLLYEFGGYPMIRSVISRSFTHIERLNYFLATHKMPYAYRSYQEHKAIYEAIASHNEEVIPELLEHHMMEFRTITPPEGYESYFRNVE